MFIDFAVWVQGSLRGLSGPPDPASSSEPSRPCGPAASPSQMTVSVPLSCSQFELHQMVPPPNSRSPGTCPCGLLREPGPRGCDSAESMLLGCVRIQHGGCPRENGRHTEAHRDGPVKTGRDQSHVYKPRGAGNHPEAGRAEEGLLPRFFRKHDFEDFGLDFGLPVRRRVRNNFCCLEPTLPPTPGPSVVITAAPGNRYTVQQQLAVTPSQAEPPRPPDSSRQEGLAVWGAPVSPRPSALFPSADCIPCPSRGLPAAPRHSALGSQHAGGAP